eukprot:494406-Pyramimonas_sp.AAC.1
MPASAQSVGVPWPTSSKIGMLAKSMVWCSLAHVSSSALHNRAGAPRICGDRARCTLSDRSPELQRKTPRIASGCVTDA